MNIKTIAFLTQLKNASLINKEFIKVDCNKFTKRVLEILYNEGFILNFRINKKLNLFNDTFEAGVHLRYINQKPIFNNLTFVSTPSYKRVLSYKQICRLIVKKKLFIFSTDSGLLTLEECKKYHKGGILLFVC